MTGNIDVHGQPKRVLMVASNPAISTQTGWPVGFWWAELTHPYWAFVEHGYQVVIASPDGGALQGDAYSDPRDPSGYSAGDLISLGFINARAHLALVETTPAIADVDLSEFDAVFLVGGQGPMITFVRDDRIKRLVADAYEAGRITAVVCHATAVLLDTRLADGRLLVEGKTWTGFANSEEDVADATVGQKLQPFRIEDAARHLDGTNFVVHGAFRAHALRDGNLITGQQQNSGVAAARLVIEALGQ